MQGVNEAKLWCASIHQAFKGRVWLWTFCSINHFSCYYDFNTWLSLIVVMNFREAANIPGVHQPLSSVSALPPYVILHN